uniref:PNP_UDP_1 domain-containing protein n=1 Tax=Angiostrongylus cantonensis TaxID=6313 RepID=A0A0K0CUY5_ANGCA
MRLDGFFCEFKPEDKMEFLKQIYEKGVRNIEMESTCFSAMTYRAGVKGENQLRCLPAIVCVALLNRMEGDQVKIEHNLYLEYEERPFRVVTALIRKQLGI